MEADFTNLWKEVMLEAYRPRDTKQETDQIYEIREAQQEILDLAQALRKFIDQEFPKCRTWEEVYQIYQSAQFRLIEKHDEILTRYNVASDLNEHKQPYWNRTDPASLLERALKCGQRVLNISYDRFINGRRAAAMDFVEQYERDIRPGAAANRTALGRVAGKLLSASTLVAGGAALSFVLCCGAVCQNVGDQIKGLLEEDPADTPETTSTETDLDE